MSELFSFPKNWVASTIGDIAATSTGGTPSRSNPNFYGGSIPWVKSGELGDSIVNSAEETLSDEGLRSSSAKIFPAGTVCIALYGATVGKLGLLGIAASTNQAVCGIFPSEGISNRYLFHYLYSIRNRLIEQGKGGAQPNISNGIVKATPLPIAPTGEQRRIVSKIEEFFSDLDASVAALERARANLKRYRAAVLKAAVEGRLTAQWRKAHPAAEPASKLLERILAERRKKWEKAQLAKFAAAGKEPPKGWKDKYAEPAQPDVANLPELPKGWCWAHIEQLCEFGSHALKAGPFGSSIKKSMYVSEGYKIYGQEQVIRDDPYYGDYYIDQKKFDELSSCAIKPGDLLISLVGTIGRTLVLPDDCAPGIINPRLIKVSLNRDLVFSAFLQAFLRSPQVTTIFKLVSHGGTMDVLNMGALKALAYPLPPLAEQKAIVDSIAAADTVVEHIESDFGSVGNASSRLRQSILKRAFEGKLVPQDPNDEPASVLLERIRAARASAPKIAARRGRKPKVTA